MTKSFMGARLRRLREERGLTQAALAQALEISPSYLNQLEHNQRPLTVAVLLKVSATLAVDVHYFSEEEEARLISDLREALSVLSPKQSVASSELRALAADMPEIGRAIVALHARYRAAAERAEDLASRIGDGGRALPAIAPMPYEEVRDFFYMRHNYIAELEEAAEHIFDDGGLVVGDVAHGLAERLASRHDVQVRYEHGPDGSHTQRAYDPKQRVLTLATHLQPGQRAFQMATQLAFLELGGLLSTLAKQAACSRDETPALVRIGLANYFAGALILPYQRFLEAAETLRYDLDLLSRRFGMGFEPVCHRVSTLQRPDARGVPFFFVRVDRAGNISKRQSATDFHFSRVGGTCPLWNVYEAFAQPGRILTQLAQMPEGRTYLWVARTVTSGGSGFGSPSKTFALGLGCDASHASRVVYSKGLDLRDPAAPVPIGAGCKVCERPTCAQRAFPSISQTIAVRENESRFVPY